MPPNSTTRLKHRLGEETAAEEERPAEAHRQDRQSWKNIVILMQLCGLASHLVVDRSEVKIASTNCNVKAEVARHAFPPQLVESIDEVQTAEQESGILIARGGLRSHVWAR